MDSHKMSEIRLNKIIADAGITSRRGADELIIDGRVSVDGFVVRELGAKFNPDMVKVMVDGETITRSVTKTYLALHKPKGVLSTMFDPEGRPSLSDFIDLRTERLFHVGRLDKDSEGLILLTNDGDLTFRATHASANSAEAIDSATKELLLEMLRANQLTPSEVISVLIPSKEDGEI